MSSVICNEAQGMFRLFGWGGRQLDGPGIGDIVDGRRVVERCGSEATLHDATVRDVESLVHQYGNTWKCTGRYGVDDARTEYLCEVGEWDVFVVWADKPSILIRNDSETIERPIHKIAECTVPTEVVMHLSLLALQSQQLINGIA